MRGHVTLCYMVVGGNLNSPLNLFISFAKALMEQGFRSDLFFAKDEVREAQSVVASGSVADSTITPTPHELFDQTGSDFQRKSARVRQPQRWARLGICSYWGFATQLVLFRPTRAFPLEPAHKPVRRINHREKQSAKPR